MPTRWRLGRLIEIRSGEAKAVFAASTTLFLFMAGHGALETARDALFLARLPAERLPFAYLAIAVVSLGAVRGVRLLSGRIGGPGLLAGSIVAVSIVTALLWLPVRSGAAELAYVVYIWTGVASTVVMLQLWQLLGDRFTVEQGKRLFALIGAAAVLGVAGGAALAGGLSARVGSSAVLLLAATLFASAAVLPLVLRGERGQRTARADPEARATAAVVWREPLAQRLLLVALLTTVTATAADYLFKQTVASSVPAEDMGAFLGYFYASVNVVAVTLQLLTASWLLRKLGVSRTLALSPIAVLAAAVAFVAVPVLALAVVVKSADGALRHSTQRTAFELLYLPLPDAVRRSAKALIDVVGHRGGQALASVLILGIVSLGVSSRATGVLVVVLAMAWLVAVLGVRGRYLELFRARLRAGVIDVPDHVPALDLASLEVVLVALNSPDEAEATTAIHLLQAQGKAHLIPPLILFHPSLSVSLAGIAALETSSRPDVIGLLERLLDSEDPARRAAALRVLQRRAPHRARANELVDDDDPLVRATAIVALAATQSSSENDARMQAIVEHGSAGERAALADAMRAHPQPQWTPIVAALARTDDATVQISCARAAAAQRSEALVPVLTDMLGDRATRDAAREAILACDGGNAVAHLAQRLSSPETPLPVRRHIPGTLAVFGTEEAARTLVLGLTEPDDGMTRFRALRALGRLRAAFPDVPLDHHALREAASAGIARIHQLLAWRLVVKSTAATSPDSAELLVALLREKQAYALERVFRLLDLREPRESYELLYLGLRRDDPKARAASREVLAHVVDSELREPLLALIDDVTDEERLHRLGDRDRSTGGARDALCAMLEDRSAAVRQVAQYHRDALGISEEERRGALEN